MYHYSQGKPTRQGHKGIPEDHFEEEQGLKGFFGPVSHLIKSKPSTRWSKIDGPLKPRMFDLVKLDRNSGSQRLLHNSAVAMHMSFIDVYDAKEATAVRNADGDLLYFCHKGSGELFSEYGALSYSAGQYVIVPRSLHHTFFPAEKSEFFVIENKQSHYEEPERGLVGRHAIYDPNAIGKPDLDKQQARLKELGLSVQEIAVKRLEETTRFHYDSCVYADVVGWKGDLYPFTLHMNHMMPLMSHRAHLPPSAHTTFVARDFVVCTFLPRPLESDDDALKVPFYHQNIDYDEVLFYHDGDFFSRDNLHSGMMSFHPQGFPHGPHPKAVKSIGDKTHTTEYAVMVDTRWPLHVDTGLNSVELAEYWKSWQG